MTGQTENKYFTEPPNYTEFQQNKQVLIAAEAVLIQTLTIMYRYTDTHSDTQTNRGTQNRKKSKRPTLLSMLVPPDTDYLYYPPDVEGVKLEGLLLPASIQ